MFAQHAHQLATARFFTAFVLFFLGVFQIASPRCFWGLSIYFKGVWRVSMPPRAAGTQRDRLDRVLEARERAEGDYGAAIRWAGALTIAMAGLVLIPVVPYAVPYALSCLGIAIAVMVSYVRFRRLTDRRVAPLVRRTPWTALPPTALLATGVCLFGAASLAVYPEFRVSAAIVVASSIVLVGIAWRVATAPAMLFGDDSQLEYAVDEHLRFCRTMSLVALACAPATVFVGLGWALLPPNAPFFNVVTLAVAAAFLVVLALSLNPIRKRFKLA